MRQRVKSIRDTELQSYLEHSNTFYQELLGYKPEKTSLIEVPESDWEKFSNQRGLNSQSQGLYLPRNQTAVIKEKGHLALFHEYFGHGLFCEQTLSGAKLIDLERKLLEEEKNEFEGREFSAKEIGRFRSQNQTFQELIKFRNENLANYELFAIWAEYLLSREFNLNSEFEKKYSTYPKESKEKVDSVINFSKQKQYGNLSTFYNFGLARRTNTERARKILEEVYKDKSKKIKFAALYGSKKEFSDIDLFIVSDEIRETYTNWLDVNVVSIENFEKGLTLFDVEITHPLAAGEFVLGDKDYFEKFKQILNDQPITEEAISFNLKNSEEQKIRALAHPENSKERKTGISYSQTYLANSFALRENKRLFTKEALILYSHGEKLIELKGGIN